jgi:SHS2 domain-containing protein
MTDVPGSGSWSLIDHTADVGLEIHAAGPTLLFETAARAFFEILTDRAAIRPLEERRITVTGGDLAELLVRWLSEILYLHDACGFLGREARVERLEERILEGAVVGESYDPTRHTIRSQVKAVTYHQALVDRDQEGWRGRVILDI